MAEVKWIKIVTDIFDDEKILLIESMPDKYAIIVCWFKLLCLAGKQNNQGVFLMNNRIAYTDEMLSTIFRMPINTVRMALQTFEQFGMIELIDGVITIPNWGKHQSLEQIEARREYQREYQKEYRKKQKLIAVKGESGEDKCLRKHLHEHNVNSLEEDIEEEKEIERDIEDIIPDSAEPETPAPKKPSKHKYGEYKNVLLTDDELEKLKAEYPDIKDRIERLSSYVASTGKSYKSHYATIRNWARKDAEKPGRKEMVPSWMNKKNRFNDFPQRETENMDEYEKMLLSTNELSASRTAANDENIRRRAEALKQQFGGA